MTDDHKETPAPSVAEQASALRTAGQRRVNLIWEVTQSLIALGTTATTLYVTANTLSEASFVLLTNAFFLVIGFYFGRTNHQRTGGVGPDQFGR